MSAHLKGPARRRFEREKARLEKVAERNARAATSEPFPDEDVVTYRIAYRTFRHIGFGAGVAALSFLLVAGGFELVRPGPDVYVTTQNGLLIELEDDRIREQQ